MRRKVIKHGISTLTISLPAKWAKKFNVEKGDELIIEEKGRGLTISTENNQEDLEKRKFNIGNLNRLGVAYLVGAYKDGYDEITLEYSDPKYLNDFQRVLMNELEGFEIIKQDKDSCTIKDLLGIEKGNLELAVRRLWVLLLSLSEDIYNAISNKDLNALQTVPARDNSVNKFSYYCMRIIMKKGTEKIKDGIHYYYTMLSLEHLGDFFKEVSNYYLNKKNLSKESLAIFHEINFSVRNIYELFYKFDEEKIEKSFSKNRELKNKIKSLMTEKNPDIVTLSSFNNICDRLRSLLVIVVEMNI